MRKVTLYCLILLLISCVEDPVDTRPDGKYKITGEQQSSDFLFAGIPVFLSVGTGGDWLNPPAWPGNVHWNFGDGSTADEITTFHTFQFPGTYAITALINNSRDYADTSLVIAPRLKLIGGKSTSENGKFILEDPVSGYHVIHTLNSGSSSDTWNFLSTTSSFDSLKSKGIALGSYPNVYAIQSNKNGNIVIVQNPILEINKTGTVLKSVPYGNGWTPTRMLETVDGYLFAGWHYTGQWLRITKLDNNFNFISETDLAVNREGFVVSNFQFESENTLRLHYIVSPATGENPPRTVRKINLLGQTLFEKEYSGDHPASMSYPLTSGYLLVGVRTANYGSDPKFVFTKINTSGDVEWSVESPLESLYPQYVHGSQPEVIEDSGFIYIFFDNQKGMKIAGNGDVKWSKRFGLSTDTFNDVVRNKEGNFVLLASHQFDYVLNQFTNDYQKRDLMFLEIDIEGNIVGR